MTSEVLRRALARPVRVPSAAILLVALVPLYVVMPELHPPRFRHAPELALDRALPLLPPWAIVYGALYLFLILLPIFVVRQEELLRRTVFAYLLIWITSYLFFFWLYPTVAPRPASVSGSGFAVWGLRALYSADPPYNCFPSLHVAHSFVSALACARVHRRLGAVAVIAALLVALSTLFTKQHYLLDVAAGSVLAGIAHQLFLRRFARDRIPEPDRRVAPALALCAAAVVATGLAAVWLVYLLRGERSFTFGP